MARRQPRLEVPLSASHPIQRRNVVAFSALAETGAALALLAFPVLAVELLLGTRPSPAGVPVVRVAGILMLALGVAGWPARPPAPSASAFRGLLLYNVLFAVYFAFLGVVRHVGGPLLWPAVVFHVAVALLLVWTGRSQARGGANPW